MAVFWQPGQATNGSEPDKREAFSGGPGTPPRRFGVPSHNWLGFQQQMPSAPKGPNANSRVVTEAQRAKGTHGHRPVPFKPRRGDRGARGKSGRPYRARKSGVTIPWVSFARLRRAHFTHGYYRPALRAYIATP
jgi:hypothetical protein